MSELVRIVLLPYIDMLSGRGSEVNRQRGHGGSNSTGALHAACANLEQDIDQHLWQCSLSLQCELLRSLVSSGYRDLYVLGLEEGIAALSGVLGTVAILQRSIASPLPSWQSSPSNFGS